MIENGVDLDDNPDTEEKTYDDTLTIAYTGMIYPKGILRLYLMRYPLSKKRV